MKLYTGMFIVQPNLTDEAYEAVIKDYEKLFTDFNSNVVEVNKWGMRDLAYEINDFRDGYYRIIKVNAEPNAVQEFSRLAKINEDIIRHIVIKEEK